MTQKRRSPHKAGNGHKLAGWVLCNSTALEAVLVLAVLAAAAIWQGAIR
ncbi:MAG: hypothetical protein KGL91_03190 [Xanthomonadaceae bacterium]|nr:hypothetical protein [Xanthomonadaceae bacterium]